MAKKQNQKAQKKQPKMDKEDLADKKDPREGTPQDEDYGEDSFEVQSAAQQLMAAQKVKANKNLHRSAKSALVKMASHAKRAAR